MILVNQKTAAGSEIIAAALQDWKRATIIGTPTAGVGTVQTIIPLSTGGGIRLTTARVFRPNGQSINEATIQPNILVQEIEGPDAPLLAALESIGFDSRIKKVI